MAEYHPKPGDEIVLAKDDMRFLVPLALPILVLINDADAKRHGAATRILVDRLVDRVELMIPALADTTWELNPSTRTITVMDDAA